MSAHPKATLFDGISEKDVEVIVQSATTKQFPNKVVVAKEGEPARHLYMVRHGRIRYFRTTKGGDEIVFCWLGSGGIFGLGCLLPQPPPYIGTAEALTDVEVLCWTHAKVRELITSNTQIGENALKMLLEYLSSLADRHCRFVSNRADERLANVLLSLGHEYGRVHNGGVDLRVTNEQLSSLADISLFTASRIMRTWSKRGLISKRRGSVLIRVPEALTGEIINSL